jgi:exopolysaccharide/PEP-CTERM locus tyrosine autokinase
MDVVPPAGIRAMDRLLDVSPLWVANPYLPTLQTDQNLAVNEAFRKLRSQVIRMTRGEVIRNALLVTSANPGEGKTLSAMNLAISLAQEYDYTVLLVDADLRKPSVHQYLGIKPEVGLIQCLRGEASLDQALIKTGLGKLVVLPAGGTVVNPVELLSSSKMKSIVREMRERYPERYVIIDSPPIGPFADAQVLSDAVDGVLFVVREGWTKIDSVRATLGSITGNKLLGVIYNDCSIQERPDLYSNYGYGGEVS